MKLPIDCLHALTAPDPFSATGNAIQKGDMRCCRSLLGYTSGLNDGSPLCLVDGEEVYRVNYQQAFGANATIRVAKRRDEITLVRAYRSGLFNHAERYAALLTSGDWDRLVEAITDADFWSLPRLVLPQGFWFDGYNLIVEGRRGDLYSSSRLVNPDVDELVHLGRVAFDLAKLGDVRI